MLANEIKKKRTYKRISKEEIELIFKLYEEKMELRKIARVLYQLQDTYKLIVQFNYESSKIGTVRNSVSV